MPAKIPSFPGRANMELLFLGQSLATTDMDLGEIHLLEAQLSSRLYSQDNLLGVGFVLWSCAYHGVQTTHQSNRRSTCVLIQEPWRTSRRSSQSIHSSNTMIYGVIMRDRSVEVLRSKQSRSVWFQSQFQTSSSFVFNPMFENLPLISARHPSKTASWIRMLNGDSPAQLKRRIKAAKSAEKVVQAVRLLTNARIKVTVERTLHSRPFFEYMLISMRNILFQIKKDDREYSEMVDDCLMHPDELEKTVDQVIVRNTHRALENKRAGRNALIVVIGASRGLCGAYHKNAVRLAEERLSMMTKIGIKVKVLCVGAKADRFFAKRHQDIQRLPFKNVTRVQDTESCANWITDTSLIEFMSGELDRVEVIYTPFKSLLSQNPTVRTLLPLNPTGIEDPKDETLEITRDQGYFGKKPSVLSLDETNYKTEFIFEQPAVRILSAMLPLYLNAAYLHALRESMSSELAARRITTQKAADNASDIIKKLTLEMNRKRQAKITNDLNELTASVNALEGFL